jgi:hypothetical protein
MISMPLETLEPRRAALYIVRACPASVSIDTAFAPSVSQRSAAFQFAGVVAVWRG